MSTWTLNLSLYLDKLRISFIVWFCAVGLVNIICKANYTELPEKYTLLSLVLPFFVTFLLCLKHFYSKEYLAAWLDLHNQAGGRIISGEIDDFTVKPGISLMPFLKAVVIPLAFFAGSLAVPVSVLSTQDSSGEGVNQKVNSLKRELENKDLSDTLGKEKVDDLMKQLEKLKQIGRKSPEAAATGLDAVRKDAEKNIFQQMKSSSDALNKLMEMAKEQEKNGKLNNRQASEMKEMLSKLAGKEGSKLSPEMQKALQDMLKKLGAKDLNALSKLPPNALNKLSSAELKKLMQAMKKSFCKNCNNAGKSMSLMSQQQMRLAMQQMLKSLPKLSAQKMADGKLVSGMQQPSGAPGTDDMGGESPLTVGDKSDPSSARFKSTIIPPGQEFMPGMTVGQERLTPSGKLTPDEFRQINRSGVVVNDKIVAGSDTATLGPRRAKAAQNYFKNLSGAENK